METLGGKPEGVQSQCECLSLSIFILTVFGPILLSSPSFLPLSMVCWDPSTHSTLPSSMLYMSLLLFPLLGAFNGSQRAPGSLGHGCFWSLKVWSHTQSYSGEKRHFGEPEGWGTQQKKKEKNEWTNIFTNRLENLYHMQVKYSCHETLRTIHSNNLYKTILFLVHETFLW